MAIDSRAAIILSLAFVALVQSVHSAQYVVGESFGWLVPSGTMNYSAWALKNNYHPGDALLFNYPERAHSVLEVNRADFANCVKTNPINHHNDGKTLIRLSRPGPHWFICGIPGHCEQGQKFQIMVTPASPGSHVSPPFLPIPSAPSPAVSSPAPSSSPPGSGSGSSTPSHHHAPGGAPSPATRAIPTQVHAPAPAPATASAAGSSKINFLFLAASCFLLGLV